MSLENLLEAEYSSFSTTLYFSSKTRLFSSSSNPEVYVEPSQYLRWSFIFAKKLRCGCSTRF